MTVSPARLSAALALSALAGCGMPEPPDYALGCMFELNPPGAYEYPAGVAVPTVVPGAGGTQAGADALNACVRDRAAAAQAAGQPVAGGQSVATTTSGGVTTQTYTYGTPPTVAGGAQTLTTSTQGGVRSETYTYGTPPAASPPAETRPVRASTALTLVPGPITDPDQCRRIEMFGGGYACYR